MQYFEIFNIPISLTVDAGSIKKKFYQLSRQYHPDFFAQASAEEQADALEKSALLNKALKVLSNTDATIKYVLEEKGLLVEDEKYKLPPDFLMEVMELNEQIQEAKLEADEAALSNIAKQIEQLNTSIYAPVKAIVEHFQEDTISEKELLQVKQYYFQKKYLDRILF